MVQGSPRKCPNDIIRTSTLSQKWDVYDYFEKNIPDQNFLYFSKLCFKKLSSVGIGPFHRISDQANFGWCNFVWRAEKNSEKIGYKQNFTKIPKMKFFFEQLLFKKKIELIFPFFSKFVSRNSAQQIDLLLGVCSDVTLSLCCTQVQLLYPRACVNGLWDHEESLKLEKMDERRLPLDIGLG